MEAKMVETLENYSDALSVAFGNGQFSLPLQSDPKLTQPFTSYRLYMTDLGENDGGETVFSEAWPPDQAEEDHIGLKEAINQLRESDRGGVLEEGSWEETMVSR